VAVEPVPGLPPVTGPESGPAVTIEARMIAAMCRGLPFTADDVTDAGRETVLGDHAPNAAQNGIGARFRQHSVEGRIVPTGRVVASVAPHRKGGMIREWVPTLRGQRWAMDMRDALGGYRSLMSDTPDPVVPDEDVPDEPVDDPADE